MNEILLKHYSTKNGYKESDSFDITEYFEDSYSGPKQKDRPWKP